jgi:hypothetical protein
MRCTLFASMKKITLRQVIRFIIGFLIIAAGLAGVSYQAGLREERRKKDFEQSIERNFRESLNRR